MRLESSPRSVKDARRWAAQVCRKIGRDDLVENAELGVSELVTNAILHGDPPVAVRLRGTRHHPRIEVLDGSPQPPRVNTHMGEEDELLTTVGRGLGIVAMSADAWGAYVQEDGKLVWFEPSTSLSGDAIDGDVFQVDVVPPASEPVAPESGTTVRLERLPVQVYLDYQRHYRELRRELRLLSLAHETDYPVATHVTELFSRTEDELRLAHASDQLGSASRSGRAHVDLDLVVPPTTPDTMAQMIDLLELADEFCRSERLLSLATTPQQNQFQRWFIGEFIRQGRGEAPRPWAGSDQVKSYSQSAS